MRVNLPKEEYKLREKQYKYVVSGWARELQAADIRAILATLTSQWDWASSVATDKQKDFVAKLYPNKGGVDGRKQAFEKLLDFIHPQQQRTKDPRYLGKRYVDSQVWMLQDSMVKGEWLYETDHPATLYKSVTLARSHLEEFSYLSADMYPVRDIVDMAHGYTSRNLEEAMPALPILNAAVTTFGTVYRVEQWVTGKLLSLLPDKEYRVVADFISFLDGPRATEKGPGEKGVKPLPARDLHGYKEFLETFPVTNSIHLTVSSEQESFAVRNGYSSKVIRGTRSTYTPPFKGSEPAAPAPGPQVPTTSTNKPVNTITLPKTVTSTDSTVLGATVSIEKHNALMADFEALGLKNAALVKCNKEHEAKARTALEHIRYAVGLISEVANPPVA